MAVAGACAVLAFQYRRRLIETARAAARGAEAEEALAAAPAGYFAFAGDGGPARCSPWLVEALALEEAPGDLDAVRAALAGSDGARLAAAVERLGADGGGFSLTVQRKDGARDFEVAGTRRESSEGAPGGVLWFSDVTAPTRALAAAEAERDDHAKLLDALPLPVWRRGTDLSLVYCNLAYARAVDRGRDEAVMDGIELAGTALAEASRGLARRALETEAGATENHHVRRGRRAAPSGAVRAAARRRHRGLRLRPNDGRGISARTQAPHRRPRRDPRDAGQRDRHLRPGHAAQVLQQRLRAALAGRRKRAGRGAAPQRRDGDDARAPAPARATGLPRLQGRAPASLQHLDRAAGGADAPARRLDPAHDRDAAPLRRRALRLRGCHGSPGPGALVQYLDRGSARDP